MPSNGYGEIHLGSNLDLSGRRGCRMHFDLRYAVQPPGPGGYTDVFAAGAFAAGRRTWPTASSSPARAAAVRGGRGHDLGARRPQRRPALLRARERRRARGRRRLRRRAARALPRLRPTSTTSPTPRTTPSRRAGSYVPFNGTSMAAPHVAGIAALVRAADPGASAADVVSAIKAGATPRPSLAGPRSASGGSANAAGGDRGGARRAQPCRRPAAEPPRRRRRRTPPPPPGAAARRMLDLRGCARDRSGSAARGRFGYRFRAAPGCAARPRCAPAPGSAWRAAGAGA